MIPKLPFLGAIIKSCHVPMEKWENGRLAMFVGYIGRLFLQALKSIIIPLVVPSLIVAIGSMDLSLSKKIGGRAIAYYMSTTFVSEIVFIPTQYLSNQSRHVLCSVDSTKI